MIATVLAKAGLNDPFVVPPVLELFEFPPIFFEGTPFAVNRTVIITLFACLVGALVFTAAFRNGKVVPSKLQAACEAFVQFIREQIAIEVIGAQGARFVPLLATIFLFVWLNNLFEIVPFVNFPSTSRMALPLFLSLIVYMVFVVLGFKNQGPGYLKNVAFPPGVPKAFYIIIAPIEFLTVFVVRPVTLAVRLFANMLAGHILLTIIFLAIHAFLFSGKGTPVGIMALAAAPLAIGFELVVGILQAYIFTMLTAVYIESSLHAEH
ncbi:MAG: F0F1 ATP synthase subunit A [Egibacteraceae bacterium]